MMTSATIAKYVGVSQSEIDSLLRMDAASIFETQAYIDMLLGLDRDFLESTLEQVRGIYEKGLPNFKIELANRYNITTDPMSAYTLGNWLVGVLRFPQSASQILKMHKAVPGQVVLGGLQGLLDMLEELPEGKEEWQKALCVISIPLMKV